MTMTAKTVRRLVLWLLTLGTAATILSLSLQPAADSTTLSTGITASVLNCIPAYRDLPDEEQQIVLVDTQRLVRELAHIFEYCVLSIFACLLTNQYVCTPFAWNTLVPLTAFSCLDECLQEWCAAGRTFQVIDLLKDALGCLIGCVLVGCAYYILNKKRSRV